MDDGTTLDRNLRDLARSAFTRRKLLKTGAFASAALGLGTLLAACGSSDDKATKTTSSGAGGGATPGLNVASPTTGGSTGSGSGTEGAKSGGKLAMSLSDSDVTNFDPIIPT